MWCRRSGWISIHILHWIFVVFVFSLCHIYHWRLAFLASSFNKLDAFMLAHRCRCHHHHRVRVFRVCACVCDDIFAMTANSVAPALMDITVNLCTKTLRNFVNLSVVLCQHLSLFSVLFASRRHLMLASKIDLSAKWTRCRFFLSLSQFLGVLRNGMKKRTKLRMHTVAHAYASQFEPFSKT